MSATRWTKWLALALGVAACSKPSASAGDASSGSAAASPLNPTPPPVASVANGGLSPASSAEAKPSPSPFPAASGSPAPATQADSAPSSESEGNTVISGCLASAGGTPTRAAPTKEGPPGVEVIAGAVPKVVHRLEHACCLHARTRILRNARSIQVVEELSGAPCRCRCSSSLTTELHVPPGDYELAVVLEQGGARSEVYRAALPVTGADGAAGAAPSKASPQLPRTIHVPAAKQ